MSFYVEEPYEAKMIRLVFPVILIAWLSTLNTINGSDLDNSISISLTLVTRNTTPHARAD